MTEKGLVAGTIMVTNLKGESYFLVNCQDGKLSFLFEEIDEGTKVPFGVMMRSLLQHVTIKSDDLRLMDLTNIRGDGFNVPLFVFDMTGRPEDQEQLLANSDHISWRRSKELTSLLNELDFSGVPVYRQNNSV